MITGEISRADQKRFNKALQQLVLVSDEPVQDILKQQGRLFAVDCAKFTARYGSTAKAGRDHKNDVKKTILSTYIRPLAMAKIIASKAGEPAGRRFSNYIRRRDTAKAEAMVKTFAPTVDGYTVDVGMFDNGARSNQRIKGNRYTRLVVMDWRSVTAYVKKKVNAVGEAKSGWAKSAEQLGGSRGIPAYAKKAHLRTRGRGKVTGKSSKTELTVTNRSKYVFSNTKLSTLFKMRIGKMEKLTTRMIKNRARKIAKKT